ncbi:MAG TPA: hypothetical protein VNP92_12570 [Actinophytocola sp.]|nr:hypothetical protein [Actinophytocola sp.]
MNAVLVRYTTRPDTAEENQRLIEQVFAELHATGPAGLRYATFRLDDGVSFVHVVGLDDDVDPLQQTAAFGEFQTGIRQRVVGQIEPAEATLVGAYRFLV